MSTTTSIQSDAGARITPESIAVATVASATSATVTPTVTPITVAAASVAVSAAPAMTAPATAASATTQTAAMVGVPAAAATMGIAPPVTASAATTATPIAPSPSANQIALASAAHPPQSQSQPLLPATAIPSMAAAAMVAPPMSAVAAAAPNAQQAFHNSMKRPLPSKGKEEEPMNEKRLRRLQKNRLSARECRRRKREATENLERQINVLEGENLKLRLQLQIGEEAEESSQQGQHKLTEGLDALLKSGASESEVFAKIEEYKEKFADYGRDRRSAIEFHLRNIERLLMPTQTTSIVLATLQGGTSVAQASKDGGASTTPQDANANPTTSAAASAAAAAGGTSATENGSATPSANLNASASVSAGAPANASTTSIDTSSISNGAAAPHAAAHVDVAVPSTATLPSTTAATAPATAQKAASNHSSIGNSGELDPKSLFQYLVQTLQVSPEQSAALKDSRFVAKEMDECLKKSLSVLKELSTRLTQCGEDLEIEFNNIRSILTPSQAAKFLVWVANNNACMHMLNELWKKTYSQSSINNDG